MNDGRMNDMFKQMEELLENKNKKLESLEVKKVLKFSIFYLTFFQYLCIINIGMKNHICLSSFPMLDSITYEFIKINTKRTKVHNYFEKFLEYPLTKMEIPIIINIVSIYGEVAQLARASGSYPAGRVFKSHLRYHSKKGITLKEYFSIRTFIEKYSFRLYNIV